MAKRRGVRSSWGMAPSRKWWAATVVGAGAVGTAWAEAGHWSQTLTVMAIGLAVQQGTAWLVPNAEAPSREVIKKKVNRRRKNDAG